MSVVSHRPPASTLARVTRAIARTTAPISRPIAGRRLFPLWAVLHHRGRRSGRAYAVPVAVRASAETFTIALPWGDRTEWVRNVLAAGSCTLHWRGGDHHADQPHVISMTDAAPAFAPLQRGVLRAAGVQSFLRLRRLEAGDHAGDVTS